MCDAVADYLEEAKLVSEDAETVLNIVEDTFLDPDFDTKWKPYRIEIVKNKHLETEFEGKYVLYVCALFTHNVQYYDDGSLKLVKKIPSKPKAIKYVLSH